jgi:hypothetical protein
MSYVTGSHNAKIGYQGSYLRATSETVRNPTLLDYRVNRGVPNRFSMEIPFQFSDRTSMASFYAQDTWTRRMTLQGALRYDRAWSWSPAEGNGSTAITRLNPEMIAFDRTVSVSGFNDITPRFGAASPAGGHARSSSARVIPGGDEEVSRG